MLERFPLGWAEHCVNIHLIRHPARVVASYAAKREEVTIDDVGYRQQAELFQKFPGPVIDSSDVRRDPEAVLSKLCADIGLSFDSAMLSWTAGPKSYDGPWASHWYNAVHKSKGFAEAEGPIPELSGHEATIAAASMEYYEAMRSKAA